MFNNTTDHSNYLSSTSNDSSTYLSSTVTWNDSSNHVSSTGTWNNSSNYLSSADTWDDSSTSPLYDYSNYYSNGADGSEPCNYEAHGRHFLPVFYSLFFIVGFLGNMLVVWVILIGVKLKSMTDVCLLNLAIADLLLVFSLPFLAHYARDSWVFGGVVCFSVLGVYHVGFYGGIFFIVLMSLDRYLAIVHAVFAMRYRTKTVGIIASLGVWVFSVIVSFPELSYLGIIEHDGQEICSAYPNGEDHKSMKIIGLFKMNIFGLLVPLIVVGFCYTMVLRRLLTVRSSRQQAIRLVVAVMVVFFCCWTPYNIAAFLKALELSYILRSDCELSKAIQLMLQATEAIAYSHSCVNPFLYVFVGQKFRNQLIRLLCRTPFSNLQFFKRYMIQRTGSVYSQTSSINTTV